jgi:hypothetical protein
MLRPVKWLALALLIGLGLAGCGGGAWKPVAGSRTTSDRQICAMALSPDRTTSRRVCRFSIGLYTCSSKTVELKEFDGACGVAREALEKAHLLP